MSEDVHQDSASLQLVNYWKDRVIATIQESKRPSVVFTIGERGDFRQTDCEWLTFTLSSELVQLGISTRLVLEKLCDDPHLTDNYCDTCVYKEFIVTLD